MACSLLTAKTISYREAFSYDADGRLLEKTVVYSRLPNPITTNNNHIQQGVITTPY